MVAETPGRGKLTERESAVPATLNADPHNIYWQKPKRIRGATLEERFRSKVVKGVKSSDCWSWAGGFFRLGYAAVWHEGKQLYAHRVSWMLHHKGSLPLGFLELDHLCRNRGCVNPKHLQLVTHQENMRRSPLVFKHGRRARRLA